MSKVKRYTFKGEAGEYVYAKDYDSALAREVVLKRKNSNHRESIKEYKGIESALLEELERQNNNFKAQLRGAKDADALQQRLTVAEQRADMLEREFKKLRDVAQGCYWIASSYSGCIDGVEEGGGDDNEDPSCAIYHRLHYAMFDADAALKPAEEIGKETPLKPEP